MASENVIDLSDDNFESEVLQADGPVLVDFWAEWCGPCRMIAPVLEEIAAEMAGKIKVGKVNVDNCPNTAAKYGIQSIPTLLIFKDGEIQERMVGALPKPQMLEKITPHVG